MTPSGCAATAEIGADAAGVLTQGVEKPRASDKTVRVTAEAYDVATTRAREAGTDRKTVVSEAIIAYCTKEINADLPRLIATTNHVTILLLGKIEQACEGETLQLDVVRALGSLTVGLVHEIPRLTALLEKSSTSERIPFDWLDNDEEAEESTGK